MSDNSTANWCLVCSMFLQECSSKLASQKPNPLGGDKNGLGRPRIGDVIKLGMVSTFDSASGEHRSHLLQTLCEKGDDMPR